MMGNDIRIGFFGLGVMGLPMVKNVIKKSGCPVYGCDVVPEKMKELQEAGGIPEDDPDKIYKNCDVIMQMLPTHETIANSVRRAISLGKPGTIIIDCSSAAPNIIRKLYDEAEAGGKHLLDSPVSGGNPMAEAGTLAIMTGGDKEIFDKVKFILDCMGTPVYTGGPGSGDTTKLVNNTIAGAYLAAIAEGYAFAAKAGIDLQTTFEATRGGFAGGPLYDNKVPKIINKDYEPGARIAVHRKDILNAKMYAHSLGIDLPVTDVTLRIMDWMKDNGHIDDDQAAMVKFFEDKMSVDVGKEQE
jgi:2-hydroxy-3-oxopropionate reductase